MQYNRHNHQFTSEKVGKKKVVFSLYEQDNTQTQ